MSDLKENKLSNKETGEVKGGSIGHDGVDKSYPRKSVCQGCSEIFSISSESDYNYLVANYTGFYCVKCRESHKK